MRSAIVSFSVLAFSAQLLRGGELPDDWAFKPYGRPAVPAVAAKGRVANPIDAFVLAKLEANHLGMSPPADRATLLRRITFDLTGLPPTPAELDAFLADPSAGAYAAAVDRLLASPRHGERAALPWLDLVRYAESDGFKADDYRPNAWRYRDYVVDSLNADTPYDRFVQEQLAGDELFPKDAGALVATGFLRHYQVETNAVNLDQRRQEILNDITDVTGQAFLGLTLGCAKCHDHKFDPITHVDYYRIQAFFAGYNPIDVPIFKDGEKARFEAARRAWDAKTAAVRAKIDALMKPYREAYRDKGQQRFPEEFGRIAFIPDEKRDPWQKQIAGLLMRQITDEKAAQATCSAADKEKLAALQAELKAFGPAPEIGSEASAMTDVGPAAPPTYRLKRGNVKARAEAVEPGYLSAIDDRTADIEPPADAPTTGRRAALAHWLTRPDHPLTARVEVNRIWQQHFGQGLVRTPADFGAQGERPSHPELLDWLAAEFVDKKWSMKEMRRLILNSNAYKQQSLGNAEGIALDPENRLLWRQNRKRLEGETLRDAILAVSGSLNPKAGGPSVYPDLPAEMKSAKWTPGKDEAEKNRRSIYVAVRRNTPFPMFAAFDGTDRCEACSQRYVTTTASQALSLLNDAAIVRQAEALAARVKTEAGSGADEQVARAFQIALGRRPREAEAAAARKYLAERPLGDLCHALMNVNEFVYVD